MALRHTHFRRHASLSRRCLTPSRTPLHGAPTATANRSLHVAPSHTSRAAERLAFRRAASSTTFTSFSRSHQPPRARLLSQRQFSSTPESQSPPNANSDTEPSSSSSSSSSSSTKESVVKLASSGSTAAAAKSAAAASTAKIKSQGGSDKDDGDDDDLTPDERVQQARAKLQEAFEQYSSAHRERSSTRTLGDLQFVRLITQFDAKMVPGAFLEGVTHAYARFNELLFDENMDELERILTPDFFEVVTSELKSRKDAKLPKIKMEISNLEASIRSVSGEVLEPTPSFSSLPIVKMFRELMAAWRQATKNELPHYKNPNPSANPSPSPTPFTPPSIAVTSGFDRQVEVEVTHTAKYRYYDRDTDKEITETSALPFMLKDGKHSSIYVFEGSSINLLEVKIIEEDEDKDDAKAKTKAKAAEDDSTDPFAGGQLGGIMKNFNLPSVTFSQSNAVLEKVEPTWLLANVIDDTKAKAVEA